jgi:hypothetical protein
MEMAGPRRAGGAGFAKRGCELQANPGLSYGWEKCTRTH